MPAQSDLRENTAGKIVARGINIECLIWDISEDAAIVSATSPVDMPSKVYLWERSSSAVFECAVQWRKAPDLFGLSFCETGKTARRSTVTPNVSVQGRAGSSNHQVI